MRLRLDFLPDRPHPRDLTLKETDVTETTITDPHEGARIREVVRESVDQAFRHRVAVAIGRFGSDVTRLLTLRREQHDVDPDRWIDLCQSPFAAKSPAEFQTLASILCVEPRWLAIGSGPVVGKTMTGWTPPPAGWFTFGTHVDGGVELEFSDDLHPDDGLPRYERPREAVAA
jgi:hypothetical protein